MLVYRDTQTRHTHNERRPEHGMIHESDYFTSDESHMVLNLTSRRRSEGFCCLYQDAGKKGHANLSLSAQSRIEETQKLYTHKKAVTHLSEIYCPPRVKVNLGINFYLNRVV